MVVKFVYKVNKCVLLISQRIVATHLLPMNDFSSYHHDIIMYVCITFLAFNLE